MEEKPRAAPWTNGCGLVVMLGVIGLLGWVMLEGPASEAADPLAELRAAAANRRPAEARFSLTDVHRVWNPERRPGHGGSVAFMSVAAAREAILQQLDKGETPDVFAARHGLATALVWTEDVDEAERLLRELLALRPDEPALLNDLGGALWMRARGERAAERLAEARALVERAAQLDPRYLPAWFNAGLIAVTAGDTAAARTAWERYLELEPEGEWADELRERLAALS